MNSTLTDADQDIFESLLFGEGTWVLAKYNLIENSFEIIGTFVSEEEATIFRDSHLNKGHYTVVELKSPEDVVPRATL